MIQLDDMKYFPIVEKLSEIMMTKTRATDPLFFRVMVSYYLVKISSMMRISTESLDGRDIPVNMYALNLATSGLGKGLSTNTIEEKVIDKFKKEFLNTTLPLIGSKNLKLLAAQRASKKGSELDEEIELTVAEFNRTGTLLFSFDSGTSPALKQLRQKLLMSGVGALNLEIDEIGSNLLANNEILTTYLELFDLGKVKTKLIKNTADNIRGEDIDGKTPANMMLFGTPSKLLNGGKTEDEFYSMLETGFARRCIFGYSRENKRIKKRFITFS